MKSQSFITLLLILLFGAPGFYASEPAQTSADTLTTFPEGQKMVVGVKISEPFIIENDDELEGLSIALWEDVARDLNLSYTYKAYPDLTTLLLAIETGEVDISINPLTVTGDRLRKMDFTQPFFITNLAIAVKPHKQGMFFRFLNKIFSWQFFMAIAVLGFIILVFGFLTWLFERRSMEKEFSNDASGLWEAFWWSSVTMTTVGYGDKSPKTVGGRVVAIIWMFTAVIIISSYTAAIATSLTVNELSLSINSLDDLRNAKIATVPSSAAQAYLDGSKFTYVTAPTAAAAIEMLADGKVDAVVYDEPILRYTILSSNLQNQIVIAPGKFFTQYYGFAMPLNRNTTKSINLSVVKEIKSNDWKAELEKYGLE